MRYFRQNVETLIVEDFAFTMGDYMQSMGVDPSDPDEADKPVDMPDNAASHVCNIWNRGSTQYKYWWER